MDYEFKKNAVQEVVSDMCGFEPRGEQGASCDYYYDLATKEEKIDYMKEYLYEVRSIVLTQKQAVEAYNFLEIEEHFGSNDRWFKFMELGNGEV